MQSQNQGQGQNQNQNQGGQFGGYGQSQGGFGGYGSYGQSFGGPQTEDYEIAEFWYIPGPGQQGMQGQGQQRQGARGRRAMQRGPHTGKGPQRSDQHIDDEIRRKLTQHGGLDASKVDVKVENGVATLTGSVDSRQAKREAENVADSVAGVKDVNNQLTIQASNGQTQNQTNTQSQPQSKSSGQ